MAKTTYTRAQWLTRLRTNLRDTGVNQTWSDTLLKECLDEALAFCQARFHPLLTVAIAGTGERAYLLPADVLKVLDVRLVELPVGTGPVEALTLSESVQVLEGYTVAYAAAADGTEPPVLFFRDPVLTNQRILVRYEAGSDPWTSDAVAKELRPGRFDEGLADPYFLACARVAAYRAAMQLLPAAGAEQYARLYAASLDERTYLESRLAGTRHPRRVGSGVF